MCVDPAPGARGRRRQTGVTLMELMFALILGGMALLGLGYVYGLNYGLLSRSQPKMALHAGATRALETINRDAGHASDFSMPSESELILRYPIDPLGDSARSEIVYKLQEERLLRNGERIVPQEGDTALHVSEFLPRDTIAERTGRRLLTVSLSLYTRRGGGSAADSLTFKTTVHARNQGLGRSSSKPSGAGGFYF